jgi:hypothetical protein
MGKPAEFQTSYPHNKRPAGALPWLVQFFESELSNKINSIEISKQQVQLIAVHTTTIGHVIT